jgi:hypothetical protein
LRQAGGSHTIIRVLELTIVSSLETRFVDDHELKMVLAKAPSSFLVLRPSNRTIVQASLISRFSTNRTRKVIRVHEPVLLCYRVINDDGGTI